MKDVEAKEVIISRQLVRGDGTDNSPYRVVTQVFEKDGTLIAENDPCPDIIFPKTRTVSLPLKKGTMVLVWSLQSFYGGGFLEGEPAFLAQDETEGKAVLLCVIRKKGIKDVLDRSYEVYLRQIEVVDKDHWPAQVELRMFRDHVINNA